MRFLTVLCLVLCADASAFAQCRPPRYREGATFVDDASRVVKSISMPLQDFGPSKLVCLATSLRQHYRDRRDILIYIFSSWKAARQSIVVAEATREDFEAFAQIHALYSLDAKKGEDYVKILPSGLSPLRAVPTEGPYSTRIDLPVVTEPHCQMEIDNRCLIALEYIGYPSEALKQQASGKVALTAMITRGG